MGKLAKQDNLPAQFPNQPNRTGYLKPLSLSCWSFTLNNIPLKFDYKATDNWTIAYSSVFHFCKGPHLLDSQV